MELTRANLVDVLESREFKVAMAGLISYGNGVREGMQSFSLSVFYDTNIITQDGYHYAATAVACGIKSTEYYRELLAK